MASRIDTRRSPRRSRSRSTRRTESDVVRATRGDVTESPMIAFPDADLDAAEHPTTRHPFDAAERVLTAVS